MKVIVLNEDFGQHFEVADDLGYEDKKTLTFTFYPKKKKFLHYHIELSQEKLMELHELIKEILENR